MEELLYYRITWFQFFLWSAVLIALYVLLQSMHRLWPGVPTGRGFKGRVKKLLAHLLNIFEPLAVLILCSMFVLVHPLLHGALLAILFLAGFTHVRNYLSGVIVRFDGTVNPGVQLQTGGVEGIVVRLSNLGMHLKTGDGLFYISYSSLLSNGFTLLSGEEMGGFYHLRITSRKEDEEEAVETNRLMDYLGTAPYLDFNHKPELIQHNGDHPPEVRILLREEPHLYELIRLMQEWGYECTVLNEKNT